MFILVVFKEDLPEACRVCGANVVIRRRRYLLFKCKDLVRGWLG